MIPVTSSSVTALHRRNFKRLEPPTRPRLAGNLFDHSPRLLTDYHQISSHRRLVDFAKVAEGAGPVCSERDGGGLTLPQYDTRNIGKRSGNAASLRYVLVNDCVKRVRRVHSESVPLRSALNVREVDDYMVSLVDSNRIRHESIVGNLEQCLIEG